jgi:hypothetical protein
MRKETIMLKIRLAVISIAIAMMLLFVSVLQAQAPAAPIPSQILTAKKVFISNAGVEMDRNYNEFYAAIKSWGRYELISAPADADLVLQISIEHFLTAVNVMNGTGNIDAAQFKLVLLDAKTGIALWTIKENIEPSFRPKTGEKNRDDALNALVGSLKTLTALPTAVK